MPGYQAHLMAGLVSVVLIMLISAWLGYHFSGSWCAQALAATLIGSLFPDIDVKSKGQKLFYLVVAMITMVLFFIGHSAYAAFLAVISFLPLVLNHRALFHSFWFIFFATFVLAGMSICWFPLYRGFIFFWAAFFLLGVFSHLVLDFGLRKTLSRLW